MLSVVDSDADDVTAFQKITLQFAQKAAIVEMRFCHIKHLIDFDSAGTQGSSGEGGVLRCNLVSLTIRGAST